MVMAVLRRRRNDGARTPRAADAAGRSYGLRIGAVQMRGTDGLGWRAVWL